MAVASAYSAALAHPVLRRLHPRVALSALGDGMSVVAIHSGTVAACPGHDGGLSVTVTIPHSAAVRSSPCGST
jgi:hypothetical protein